MENQTLIAVPLFVLMGVILERSKVADDLLHTASRLLAKVRGGLGYAVVIVGALLAASTGIVGATVVTMTLIALPTMLKQGYDPRLAAGTIAASGNARSDHPAEHCFDPACGCRIDRRIDHRRRGCLGWRSVCRRDSARPDAGWALPALSDRDSDPAP